MVRIQVVLSNLPGLLRDIVVDALSKEADIGIAGEAHSADELERILDTQKTDLVVTADRDSARACGSRRLPKFLVLTESGSAAFLHWMQPKTSSLGQLTPDELVREIRAAARLDFS